MKKSTDKELLSSLTWTSLLGLDIPVIGLQNNLLFIENYFTR